LRVGIPAGQIVVGVQRLDLDAGVGAALLGVAGHGPQVTAWSRIAPQPHPPTRPRPPRRAGPPRRWRAACPTPVAPAPAPRPSPGRRSTRPAPPGRPTADR